MGGGVDEGHAGETAEGGKNAVVLAEVEAGKTQALAAEAMYEYAGVYVATEGIEFTVVHAAVVGEEEGRKEQLGFDDVDGGIAVPGVLEDVVVAAHEGDAEGGKIVPPFFEPIELGVGMAVKKIAYNHQLFRVEMAQKAHEALQVFLIHRLRHGNPRLTEMAGLAEMKIGNDEGFFFFPKKCPLARKPKVLPAKFM